MTGGSMILCDAKRYALAYIVLQESTVSRRLISRDAARRRPRQKHVLNENVFSVLSVALLGSSGTVDLEDVPATAINH
jgi:hypothetical protein